MKKVLSFVLVLSLVLSSVSMAFAAEVKSGLTDVDGNANEVAIKVVNDLGIVAGYPDGTFKADKAVNRAEFAVMITKALNIPESALAGYTATSFTDIAGYEWAVPYLAFCESKGVISGYGNGIVKPGNTITVNEAMTMALRAIGLTPNSALLVGTWPSNYVTIAQQNDLYADVAALTTVDRGSAAQIIYNALTVPGYIVNADGNTTRGPLLINSLTDPTNNLVDVIVDYDQDSLIPLAQYIGAFADEYYNADGEIVAIDVKSTFLEGKTNEDATIFTVDDVEYTFAAGAKADIAHITNGAIASTDSALAADASLTLSVDVVGKTIRTVYADVAWDKDTYGAEAVIDDLEGLQDEIADDLEILGVAFEKDVNNEIDETSYELYGVKALDKIAEDNIVYVYKHPTLNTVLRIEVGTEVVTGKVTKVYDDEDGEPVYVIGGKDYYSVSETFNAGDEAKFYLDYAGDIYKSGDLESAAGNYAIWVASDSATTWGETTYKLKLFTAEGTTITPEVADEISATAIGFAVNDIVEYTLDKDGVLEDITAAGIEITGEVTTDLVAQKKLAANLVVVTYDGEDYAIGKVADLAEDVTSLPAVINDDFEVEFIFGADANVALDTEAVYGIITATGAKGLDADDEEVDLVDVILGTTAKTDVQLDSGVSANLSITSAAIYEITVDEAGVITDISTSALTATETITTVAAISGSLITSADGDTYKLAEDVIVYIYDAEDDEWSVGKVSGVKKLTVELFETDDDVEGYEYVLAY